MMDTLVQDLPAIFDTFSDQRRQSFLAAKEFKEQGNPLVGIFCTYLPIELPLAAGAGVVSLCSVSDETIPAAEQDLPRKMCIRDRMKDGEPVYLTGGLCEQKSFITALGNRLGHEVASDDKARFAGAIGAALFAMKL